MTNGYEDFREEAQGGKYKNWPSFTCHILSVYCMCSPLLKQSDVISMSYTATFYMIWQIYCLTSMARVMKDLAFMSPLLKK